jgi:hypothetical protein
MEPRYSKGEVRSEAGISNLINTGLLGKETVVVLDSGGPHSVAMAIKLARELGYQPIVMLDAESSEPNQSELTTTTQSLATMLHFSVELDGLRKAGKINKDSPPAFILDAHRNVFSIYDDARVNDNRYEYSQDDFPDVNTLKDFGINRVVYINEGDQNGLIDPSFQSIDRVKGDLKDTVTSWEGGGVEMIYTGVSPW